MATPATAVPESVWKVTGWTEKVYQPAPGMPYRAAGSCEQCGQGIRYVVSLRNQFGVTMNVGQDCAETMVGGEELREIRSAQRAYERACYLASDAHAHAEGFRAGKEFLRRERAQDAEITYFMQLAGFRKIAKSPNISRNDQAWAASVVEGILDGRGCPELTDATDDGRDSTGLLYEIASLPPSKYTGRVGQKLKAEALFEACLPFVTQYGRSYVQKYRCADGALLVWFSRGGDANVGDWVTLTGTVKGHENRYGEEQTVMTRCKVQARP